MINVKPILVVMVWRGGERFARCLSSVASSAQYFSRIVLSITSELDSSDVQLANAFKSEHPEVEVICTGVELPTMQHQDYWVTYLEQTGAKDTDWIYWLAYDDQVWPRGLQVLTNSSAELSLDANTVYFGPWAMRHEQPDTLWAGSESENMEVWTSFPAQGPTTLPLLKWITDQIHQPTYMQMSGSVIPFANYVELRDSTPKKTGPMRIEMATAAGRKTHSVSEFAEPISVIYGRSNSDRATYGSAARKEDIHLIRYLLRHATGNPREFPELVSLLSGQAKAQLKQRFFGSPAPTEEWRVRGMTSL